MSKPIEFDRYTQPNRDFHNWNIAEWKKSILRLHDFHSVSSDCSQGPACWQALVVTPASGRVEVPESLIRLFKPAPGRFEVDLNLLAPLTVEAGNPGHSCRSLLEQWGTHGVLSSGVYNQNPLGLRVEFATSMFPADEAMRRLSASYPGLEFRLTYANRANARGGEFIFKAGEVVSEKREGVLREDRWLAVGLDAEYWTDEVSDPWGSFGMERPTDEDLAWLQSCGLKYHEDQVLRSLRQPLVRAYILASRGKRERGTSQSNRFVTLALGVELKLDKHVNLAIARKKGMAMCACYPETGANDRCLAVSPESNEDWLDEHLVLIHASHWIRHHASNYDEVWGLFRDHYPQLPMILKTRVCQMVGNRFPQSKIANESIAMGVKLHSNRIAGM